jgi:ATPase family AAA domain-containing protein 2
MAGIFTEIRRHKPAVLFIPDIDAVCLALHDSALKLFMVLLRRLAVNDPVLVLATTETDIKELPADLQSFLVCSRRNKIEIDRPNRVS